MKCIRCGKKIMQHDTFCAICKIRNRMDRKSNNWVVRQKDGFVVLPRLNFDKTSKKECCEKMASEIFEVLEAKAPEEELSELMDIAQRAATRIYHLCSENGIDVEEVNYQHEAKHIGRGNMR